MIDGFVLFVPLLILPILFLFRFIGCAKFSGTDYSGSGSSGSGSPASTPSYESQVIAEPSLLAYWRLGEAAPLPPPAPTLKAKDDAPKGLNIGDYVEVAASPGTNLSQGPLTGKANRGAPNPGLLHSEPTSTSVDFEGGYVRVPNFGTVMATYPSFTIEAWVLPKTWQAGSATTPFAHIVMILQEIDPAVPSRGFALFAQWVDGISSDPPLPAGKTPGFYWSISVGTGTGPDVPRLTLWDKQVILNQITYLGVTYDTTKSELTLYVAMGDTEAGQWTAGPLTTPYAPAVLNHLYIGAGSVTAPPGENIYGPFVGYIQEVAVYGQALDYNEHAMRVGMNLPPMA